MERTNTLYVCPNDHHSLDKDHCPFCGLEAVKEMEYRDGDCIDCGNLCPGYAYACNTPYPLQVESK